MTKLSPQELKRRHQEKMVKDLVKTSDKWAKEHDIKLKAPEDNGDFFRYNKAIEYRQEQRTGLVEIFVKLTLPINAYETAAGLYRIADYKTFDDYVSDCVMNDLEQMCQGEVADDVVISKLTQRETEFGAPYKSDKTGGTRTIFFCSFESMRTC
jgi:hypothetical protein